MNSDFETIDIVVQMREGELVCDNVKVPPKIQDEGATKEMIGELLCVIGKDMISGRITVGNEQ